jgi:predicted DNA-binding transcriptional regulator AlpA
MVTYMEPQIAYQPPRQFARTTGISESTLAKMRMRGDGPPFVKVGRSVRYELRSGLAWMAARTRRSTSDPPSNERRPRKTPHGTARTASLSAELAGAARSP